MTTSAQTLSEFVVRLHYEDIPAEVIERATPRTLWIGVRYRR